jgi:hypothetical protein
MVNVIIAVVLVAHGIGHIMGPLQVLKVASVNPQWHGDSWLLSGTIGTTLSQGIGMVLWTAALVGFVLLGGVVLGWLPASWWEPLAIGASIASMVGLLFFPTAFPTFSTIGALVADIAVLAAVLWFHWVPSGMTA